MTKILGIAASLREKSHTRKLVKLTLEEAQRFGAQTRLLDLRATPLPLLYDPQPSEQTLKALEQTREMVLWADAFLLSSPDYHGTVSATAKNFLDNFWREFTGKLFGFIVASHEKGLTVQDQMRTAVRQCYGWAMPYGLGFNGDQAFDAQGKLIDPSVAERAQMLARDLTVYGALLHGQFQADLAQQPRQPGFAQKFEL